MKKVFIAICCVVAFIGMVAYNVNHNKIDETKEVLVSAFLPLTGPLSSLGTAVKEGITLAVEAQNAKGGIGGKKIIFKPLDTRGDPKEAITLFHGQVENQKPLMIFAVNTGVAVNLQKLTEPHKIPLIAAVSAGELLAPKNRFTVRTVFSPTDFAKAVSKHIAEKYAGKKIKFFYENVDYSLSNKKALSEVYQPDEWEIYDFDSQTLDYRTLLLKSKLNSEKDVVILSGLGPVAGRMIRQMREMGYTGDILGDATLTMKGAIDIAGEAMNNTYALVYRQNMTKEHCQTADQKYRAKWHIPMNLEVLTSFQITLDMLSFLSQKPQIKDLRGELEGIRFDGCLGPVEIQDGQAVYSLHFMDMGGKR